MLPGGGGDGDAVPRNSRLLDFLPWRHYQHCWWSGSAAGAFMLGECSADQLGTGTLLCAIYILFLI